MTGTVVNDTLRVNQWDAKHHKEYIRSNRFKRYMGATQNSIIMVKENLTKKKGDSITIPLVGALDTSNGYNNGSSTLVGKEKALPNEGHSVKVGVVRDATLVNVEEEQASAIGIRAAGKIALKDLQMRYLRDDLISAFGSKNGVNYPAATEAQKNTWLTGNSDRVLFGNALSNATPGDHAASLSALDAGDTFTGHTVDLAKELAQTSSTANGNGIRPYTHGDDFESYVMFVNTRAFRDFRNWLTETGNLKDAMERGRANPLFAGPESFEWNGVMIRKIPEMGNLPGVGAGGVDVAESYFCGTQALAAAWAMRTKSTTRKEDDYEFQYGVGFMELRGVNKVQYEQGTPNAKDWGMVTVYSTAQASQ